MDWLYHLTRTKLSNKNRNYLGIQETFLKIQVIDQKVAQYHKAERVFFICYLISGPNNALESLDLCSLADSRLPADPNANRHNKN